jgi:hypothetical protein
MKYVVVVLSVAAIGCSSASKKETWEMLMAERGFALGHLTFDPSGAMHAVEAVSGRTLERSETWGGWSPMPGFVASHRPRVASAFRLWDLAGNVYVSANVIYRAKRGTDEWQKVPGSEGRQLVTVDQAGNVYADGRVLLAGTSEWKPSGTFDRLDSKGRPYSGQQRYDGEAVVTDQQLLTAATRFDANGDVLEATLTGGNLTVTRREFGGTATTELVKTVTERYPVELVGCGLEGTCILLAEGADVFEAKGSTLRQIGSLSVTSSGEALNLLGATMTVDPGGRAYAWDVSGQGLTLSRVFRLVPGTDPWPGEKP